MQPASPRGFRDVLAQEAEERDVIARAIGGTMAAWGYGRVETPAVEEYTTLEAGAGGSLEGTAFRLFDADGRLLALRPEMTVPIARMAATRLAGAPGPYRVRYVSEVFREQAAMRGQARQFTQAGLELIGTDGPAADAEVIAVLVESLRAAGLPQFTVGVGTVAVLRALIAGAGMDEAWGRAVLDEAQDRNLVGIDALSVEPGVPADVATALRAVPRIRGDRGAISSCRKALQACGIGGELDALDEVWQLLELLGAQKNVAFDFGIMRSFDYYTGIVLEVYAPGLGLAIGGGGRYDGVMGEFGAPMPAAGFAVGVERLHIALSEQGCEPAAVRLDAVLGGRSREAFPAAARLRAAGWRVRLSNRTGAGLAAEALAAGAGAALLAGDGRILRLDDAGEPCGECAEQAPVRPGHGVSGGRRQS